MDKGEYENELKQVIGDNKVAMISSSLLSQGFCYWHILVMYLHDYD